MHNYKQIEDQELITLYQSSGDNQLLGVLLERHMLLLLGLAMKYLRDKDLAKDAVQQVVIKVLTHFPKETILNFKGWLYILMRNHCLAELKNQSYPNSTLVLEQLRAPETKTTREWMLLEENRQNILAAIGQLSEAQAQCVQLFYLEEKSYKEIMEFTGLSFDQVKSYIQNGKRNLKIALENKINWPHA